MKGAQNSEKNSDKAAPKKAPGKPFTKGDPRINRGGRPKAQLAFADWIAEQTEDGHAMASFALDVLEGRIKANTSTRLDAAKWLTDRWIGKVPQSLELTGRNGGPLEVTDARERLIARLTALAAKRAESGAPPEPK